MRRVLLVTLIVAGAAAFVLTQSGARNDDKDGKRFTVELDNAFGLVAAGDVKVAGVRAGKVTKMDVDPKTKHALVEFKLTEQGFGSLRSDVFCETRPQSLIGEYFIDCNPGKAAKELPSGSTIPIEHTASTVPADLINNVMRRPFRERLRLILNELGAGVAGRAEDLNAAVRRASPALRETDRVLRILGHQNQVLKDLTQNADTVITDLANNRRDVGRWVTETKETAAASAERRAEIAAGFRRLPGFLRELRPTMGELGKVADAQTPALQDLDAAAGELKRLFDNLKPFAESTQVNLRSLGEASRTGRNAVRAARPTVAQLNAFSEKTPELANNLAIVLHDLDDRNRAVEPDPRSPGGKGYTGLEAILQYVFDQTMAVNVFDQNGYILKINLFFSKCSDYQNADSIKKRLKEDPSFLADCMSELGPNQPGVTTPDPTDDGSRPGTRSKSKRSSSEEDKPEQEAAEAPQSGGGGGGGNGGANSGGGSTKPKPPDIDQLLDDLLNGQTPSLPDVPDILNDPNLPEVPGVADALDQLGQNGQGSPAQDQALLDYLLGG